MYRSIYSVAVVALGLLGAVGSVFAHHPPKFERCQAVTVEGVLQRIEWANPHVRLVVETDDGASHTLSWLNLQRLRLAGIEPDTLRIGDRLIVTGTQQSRTGAGSLLLHDIQRAADGWAWSQEPQGCT